MNLNAEDNFGPVIAQDELEAPAIALEVSAALGQATETLDEVSTAHSAPIATTSSSHEDEDEHAVTLSEAQEDGTAAGPGKLLCFASYQGCVLCTVSASC
jgi:hypothetical protein